MLRYLSLLCLLSLYSIQSLYLSRNLVTKISTQNDLLKYSRLYMGSEFERNEPIKKTDKVVDSEVEIQQPLQQISNPEEISSSMKEKLRQELRSQGADPNYSAGPLKGNPIVIVSIVIAVLVLLGGKDFFY